MAHKVQIVLGQSDDFASGNYSAQLTSFPALTCAGCGGPNNGSWAFLVRNEGILGTCAVEFDAPLPRGIQGQRRARHGERGGSPPDLGVCAGPYTCDETFSGHSRPEADSPPLYIPYHRYLRPLSGRSPIMRNVAPFRYHQVPDATGWCTSYIVHAAE